MKKAAAIEALKFVKPGMNIGLGTGSTSPITPTRMVKIKIDHDRTRGRIATT